MNINIILFAAPSALFLYMYRGYLTYSIRRRIRMHKLSLLSNRVHYIVPAVLFIFSFLLLLIPPLIVLRYSTPLLSHPIIDLSETIQYFLAGSVFLAGLIVLLRPRMPRLSKWAVYSHKQIDTYPSSKSNNQEHNDTQVSFACLIIPFSDDSDVQKKYIDAASHLVSNKIRSFEIIYTDKTFHFHFVCESKQDLDHMISIYRQFFPSLLFDYNCDVSIPQDKKLMMCYVTNKNHHPFVLYDLKQVGKLIGPLLASLRQTDFAWIQIIWTEFSSHHLNDLHSTINDKVVDIETPREKEINKKIVKYDHPAKYSEFHRYSNRLLSHLISKSGSRLCIVFVRCAVSNKTELPFAQIQDADEVKMHLPFSQISTQTGEGKVGERLNVVWTKSDRLLDDMIARRIDRNECDRMLADFVKNYLRDRYLWSLPFLLMTPQELALLVHLPSASLSGEFSFKTTRGSFVPRPRGEVKKGIAISQ
jgi:hypothetical protein